MSNFNYCPLIWHFCGEVNTKKIEKIQERALRFIYQDYYSSYNTLLGKSQLPSLKVRRLRAKALQAFKILNNQTPVYLSDLFKGIYLSKALTCMKCSCINIKCSIIKETDTFGHLVG